MEYWSVPREWAGETVAILGGGPSLEGLDLDLLRDSSARIIAINDAFRIAPWADILYFCDRKWWDGPLGRAAAIEEIGFQSLIVTLESEIPGVLRLQNTGETGLEWQSRGVRTGRNSGYQAINLAYHLGVSRIILFGYDFRVRGSKTHWGERPEPQQPMDFAQTLAREILPCFPSLVDPLVTCGVEVINASPGSALRCWPVVGHTEGLRYCRSLQRFAPAQVTA